MATEVVVVVVVGGGERGGGEGGGRREERWWWSDGAVNERSLSITHHGMQLIMGAMSLWTRPPGRVPVHTAPKRLPNQESCQRLLPGNRQGHHVRATCRMKRSKHLLSKSETSLACPMAMGTGSCSTANNQSLHAVGEHVPRR